MPVIKISFADLARGPSGAAYQGGSHVYRGDYGLGEVSRAVGEVVEWNRRNDEYTTKLVHAQFDVDADKWESEQLARTDLNKPSGETGETGFATVTKEYDKYLKGSTQKAMSSVPRSMRRKFKTERTLANDGRWTAFHNTIVDRQMAQNFVDAKGVIASKAGGDSPDPQGAVDYALSMKENIREDRYQALVDYAREQAVLGVSNVDPDMGEQYLESIRNDVRPDQYDGLKAEIRAVRNRQAADFADGNSRNGAALTARYLATLRGAADKPVTPMEIEDGVANGLITPARGEVMSRRLAKPATDTMTEKRADEQRANRLRAYRIMTRELNRLVQGGDRKRFDAVYDAHMGELAEEDAEAFLDKAESVRDAAPTSANKLLTSARDEADKAATKALASLFNDVNGEPYDPKGEENAPEPVELAEAVGSILMDLDVWAKEHTKNDKTLDLDAYRTERNKRVISEYRRLAEQPKTGLGTRVKDWIVGSLDSPQGGTTKTLTREGALALLKEAGGDKDKARQLARERGYSF